MIHQKYIAIFMAFLLLNSAGCSTLSHVDELLTLKDLSESQEGTDQYVESMQADFKRIKQAVIDGDLDDDNNKRSILEQFGEPVLKERIENENSSERWIYRDPVEFFKTDKVMVYFNEEGSLVNWDFQEGRKDPSASK